MQESKRKEKVNPYPGAFRQTTFFHAMHQRKSHAGMRLRKVENRKRKTPENAKQVSTSTERRQEDVMRAEVMVKEICKSGVCRLVGRSPLIVVLSSNSDDGKAAAVHMPFAI
jgi:hypothetical protein